MFLSDPNVVKKFDVASKTYEAHVYEIVENKLKHQCSFDSVVSGTE